MTTTKKHGKTERVLSLSEQKLVQDLRFTMNIMQNDPELEEVETLSAMEDVISDALYHFTDKRHHTRDKEESVS